MASMTKQAVSQQYFLLTALYYHL